MAPLIRDERYSRYKDTAGTPVKDDLIEPGEQELVYCVTMSFVITLALTPAEEAAITEDELAQVLVENLEVRPKDMAHAIDTIEMFERRVSRHSATQAQPEEGR